MFLSHTNPFTQRQLSDQKTSRCVCCVHRGVNVKSLAVQYPLYFSSLTRQNELYHCVSPYTTCVCMCVCLKRGGGLTSACVTLLSSFISLCSVLQRTCQVVTMQHGAVQPELPTRNDQIILFFYCSNRCFFLETMA